MRGVGEESFCCCVNLRVLTDNVKRERKRETDRETENTRNNLVALITKSTEVTL